MAPRGVVGMNLPDNTNRYATHKYTLIGRIEKRPAPLFPRSYKRQERRGGCTQVKQKHYDRLVLVLLLSSSFAFLRPYTQSVVRSSMNSSKRCVRPLLFSLRRLCTLLTEAGLLPVVVRFSGYYWAEESASTLRERRDAVKFVALQFYRQSSTVYTTRESVSPFFG